MTFWRIRVTLSDDPQSLARFNDALSLHQVSLVRLDARGDAPGMTGEVIIGLGEDEHLGDMLGALHQISPQVYVSRADAETTAAQAQLVAGA